MKERPSESTVRRLAVDIVQDLKFAARLLTKNLLFTIAAILTLALGIGMNGTMFAIVNAMIRGLPIDTPKRILSLHARDAAGHWRELGVSYPDFRDFQAATRTFAGLAAVTQATLTLGEDGRGAERASASYVSANTFHLLGVVPVRGRDFTSDDDRTGAPPVVILGSRLWATRYNADPGVVGRVIRVNRVASTVVGVMPDGFRFPVISDLWQPLAQLPGLASQRRDMRRLQVFGSLGDRSTRAQAQSEVASIAARLAFEYPETNANIGAIVAPYPPHFAPDPILVALMSAVDLVLLVASINVANLLLARSIGRSREVSIRVSLGATRWRIIRQFLVESGLLAAAASAIGYLFANAGVWLFANAVTDITFPYYIRWTIDANVRLYIVCVCFGTAWLVGLLPAFQVSKLAASRSLQDGARTSSGGAARRRWMTALLSAELAVTVILLAGAGLMMRSYLAVYRADSIVDAKTIATMPLSLPGDKYRTPDQRAAAYYALEQRLTGVPGVAAAAFANVVPFAGGSLRQLSAEGRSRLAGNAPPMVSYVTIRGRYFEALGLRLLRGRTFIESDGMAGTEGAIVNQRLAAMFFPNEDPIGRRICLTAPNAPPNTLPSCCTILGISPTVRQQYFQEIDPVVYVPDRGDASELMLIVRGHSTADAVAPLIRSEVFAFDADISLNAIMPLDRAMTQSRWGHRVFGGMLTIFAFTGLLLSSVGLYAITAFSVVQRTQEIGVRMALGAPPRTIVWLFVKRITLAVAFGLVVGLSGALAFGRLVQSLLIQTSAADPATLVGIALLLGIVSLLACVFPAQRATRVDPLAMLRYD